MQIHEITQLNEAGILQGIKRAATGAIGALTKRRGDVTAAGIDAQTDRASAKKLQAVADKAVPAWLQYSRQLKAANPDPSRYATLYKQSLQAFVQKNLMGNQPIVNAVNRQEIEKLINNIVAVEADANQVAQLFPKLIQQTALSTSDVSTAAGQLQVRVINPDPAILQFRNVIYNLNDQGEWANQATGEVANQSFQAFLDQELAKAQTNPAKGNP